MPIPGLVSISIEPEGATLAVGPEQPSTLEFTAMGTFDDSRVEDVTARVQFTISDDAGAFTDGTLAAIKTRGFEAMVTARNGEVMATTPLTGKLTATYIESGMPPIAVTALGAAPTIEGARIEYPADNTIVPPNLRGFGIRFSAALSDPYWMLVVEHPLLDVRVMFQPVSGGMDRAFTIPPEVWTWISETVRGRETMVWNLRSTKADGVVKEGPNPRHVQVAPDDLEGALYYATLTTNRTIRRVDFSTTAQSSDPFLASALYCYGCHAVSPNGRKFVGTVDGASDGRFGIYDVSSMTPTVNPASGVKAIYASWNPDGSKFVAARYFGDPVVDGLEIRDGTTGAVAMAIPLTSLASGGRHVTTPDWSPDGTKIVFAVGNGTTQMNTASAIHAVDIDQQTLTTTQPVAIAMPTGGALATYYSPAFAPDNETIAFNEAPGCSMAADCDTYDDARATLVLTKVTSGSTVVQLGNANGGTNLGNSHPKWNRKVYRKTNAGGRLAWIAFASKRPYGSRTSSGGVWIAAIDLDAQGTDPSSAAFYLPSQDLTYRHYQPRWTTAVP